MVNNNYFADNNLLFHLSQKVKDLLYYFCLLTIFRDDVDLLQKKRKRENFNLNEKKDFIIKKYTNLSELNKIKGNLIQHSYPINFETIKVNNTEKFQDEFFKNESLSPNKKIVNFKDNIEINLSNDLSKKNFNEIINICNEDISKDLSKVKIYQNNTCSKKNFSNVVQEDKPKKTLIKRNVLNTENNNEIKVLKNNKVVYINTYLLNSYSSSRNIKTLNNIAFVGRNKRSSQYRGVSKNGNLWQVLMMINNNQYYLGRYPSEELAARIYDILAIKNRGVKARTNFVYNNNQIKKICESEIDLKSANISDIIEQLIN
jgi:hypothetical protein